MILQLLDKIQSIVIPAPACILCLCSHSNRYALCEACVRTLPFIDKGCFGCGLPLAEDRVGPKCGLCLISPLPFEQVRVAFEYKWPCDHFISQFKFKKKLELAPILGHLMANHFKKQELPLPACLIPVPLHLERLKERGFNQAYVLAKIIGRVLNIPVLWNAVYKTKSTPAQSSLSFEQRIINLQQAFRVSSSFPSKLKSRVAIIDDVMTTGQTVSSLTLALKAAGVSQVEVWCCARTLKTQML